MMKVLVLLAATAAIAHGQAKCVSNYGSAGWPLGCRQDTPICNMGSCGPLQAVIFAGATGVSAPAVNGVFKLAGGVVNVQDLLTPVFLKVGDVGLGLLVDPDTHWVVAHVLDKYGIDTGMGKVADRAHGYAVSFEAGLMLPTDATEWTVYDGTAWSAQSAVTCVAATEEQVAAAEAAWAARPTAVMIQGATGANAARINGVFKPVAGEVVNGKPVFLKVGDVGIGLWFTPNNQWVVALAKDKGADSAHGYAQTVWGFSSMAYTFEAGLMLPTDATAWTVYNGAAWSAQPTVTCVAATEEQAAAAEAPPPAPGYPPQWTMCVWSLGENFRKGSTKPIGQRPNTGGNWLPAVQTGGGGYLSSQGRIRPNGNDWVDSRYGVAGWALATDVAEWQVGTWSVKAAVTCAAATEKDISFIEEQVGRETQVYDGEDSGSVTVCNPAGTNAWQCWRHHSKAGTTLSAHCYCECAIGYIGDACDTPTVEDCAANYESDAPCCMQGGADVPLINQCPQATPYCHGYVHGKHFGTCSNTVGVEVRCAANYESKVACCMQGDADVPLIDQCLQATPFCHGYVHGKHLGKCSEFDVRPQVQRPGNGQDMRPGNAQPELPGTAPRQDMRPGNAIGQDTNAKPPAAAASGSGDAGTNDSSDAEIARTVFEGARVLRPGNGQDTNAKPPAADAGTNDSSGAEIARTVFEGSIAACLLFIAYTYGARKASAAEAQHDDRRPAYGQHGVVGVGVGGVASVSEL